ncbi:MAG: hypothetical protein WCB19_07440 [Thermoplasmata archaeon]
MTIKDGDATLRIRGTMERLDAIEIGNEVTALCDLYIKAKKLTLILYETGMHPDVLVAEERRM